MTVPRWYAAVGPAYLAALLAVDTQVGLRGQLMLGGLSWFLLLAALRPLPALARAQALAVVTFATAGEVTGSLLWGVYRYRLHNLPLFIPPAHGLVYLSGLALVGLVRTRWLVVAAAVGSIGWGLAGLTVFLVVAALELYGTTIGTWRWAVELPGLGIPDGNPPSGVASGYVWFDVMALLVAPWLVYAAGRLKPKLATRSSGDFRSSKRRIEPSGMISASGSSSSART